MKRSPKQKGETAKGVIARAPRMAHKTQADKFVKMAGAMDSALDDLRAFYEGFDMIVHDTFGSASKERNYRLNDALGMTGQIFMTVTEGEHLLGFLTAAAVKLRVGLKAR